MINSNKPLSEWTEQEKNDRRAFLSKSFKRVVGASVALLATKVPAYQQEFCEDSTDVVPVPNIGVNVTPPQPNHLNRDLA